MFPAGRELVIVQAKRTTLGSMSVQWPSARPSGCAGASAAYSESVKAYVSPGLAPGAPRSMNVLMGVASEISSRFCVTTWLFQLSVVVPAGQVVLVISWFGTAESTPVRFSLQALTTPEAVWALTTP